jgi:protein involved in polysaccharide export with SLBB domain
MCLALPLGGCLVPDGPVQPLVAEDVLKPGDSLSIIVAGENELSGGFVVNGDGSVRLELLGAVPAAGLSVAGFQEQVRQRLAAGYLKDPQVRVERVSPFAVPPLAPASLPLVLRPSQ